jgi:hypothetical protein
MIVEERLWPGLGVPTSLEIPWRSNLFISHCQLAHAVHELQFPSNSTADLDKRKHLKKFFQILESIGLI